MKKCLGIFLTALTCILFSTNAFSYNKTVDGKLGTGYADDPDKFGWQLNFAYLYDLDPFFALGFEPGIYWAHWDRKVGRKQVGSVNADLKADSNAYLIPLLMDAQVRFPNLEKKVYVVPYITLGLGYSLMILDYSTPSYTDTSGDHHGSKDETKLFGGLTWQLMCGASFDPGSSSKIRFLAEAGYRGAKVKNDDIEVDMSGFIINIGVRYPLGNSEPEKSIQ